MDNSLDPNSGDTDTSGDIPVQIDTLTLDGTNPKVGDHVDLKVTGTVTQIKNSTAFVNPETVNDQPMPPDQKDPNQQDMLGMAQNADAGGVGIGSMG